MCKLTKSRQEMSSGREEATAMEVTLRVELPNALTRCAVAEREFDLSSNIFRRQWGCREAKLKGEQGGLQQGTGRLSCSVLKLTQCLQNEQARSEALAEEVCLAATAEEPGAWGVFFACRGFGMTESLDHGPRPSGASALVVQQGWDWYWTGWDFLLQGGELMAFVHYVILRMLDALPERLLGAETVLVHAGSFLAPLQVVASSQWRWVLAENVSGNEWRI